MMHLVILLQVPVSTAGLSAVKQMTTVPAFNPKAEQLCDCSAVLAVL